MQELKADILLQAASQITYFQNFQQRCAIGRLDPTTLDDSQELKLVLEVADIIDELKMIRHLVETQKDVLQQLRPDISRGGAMLANHYVSSTEEKLIALLSELQTISDDASYTHRMVRLSTLR